MTNRLATTSNPASKFTFLPYDPPSTLLQSNSAASGYESSRNEASNGATSIGKEHSSVRPTTNINDPVQSSPTKTVPLTSEPQLTTGAQSDAHLNGTTESQGTSTIPTTSRKDTEAKLTSTHKQSPHPLEKADDTFIAFSY